MTHFDVVVTVLSTMGLVGVGLFVYWLVSRVNWLTNAATNLHERVSAIEDADNNEDENKIGFGS